MVDSGPVVQEKPRLLEGGARGTTQTLYAEGLHRAEIEGSDENPPPQSNSGSGDFPLPQRKAPPKRGKYILEGKSR
jgi:hypothetical protein